LEYKDFKTPLSFGCIKRASCRQVLKQTTLSKSFHMTGPSKPNNCKTSMP